MGEQGFLLDTNILIYLEKGIADEAALAFLSAITIQSPFISVVTEMEVLGFSFASLIALQRMEALVADTIVLSLDRAVALQTITIRRQHKIKLPDAVIAATALVHKLTLVTNNPSDFNRIGGLTVVNPFLKEK